MKILLCKEDRRNIFAFVKFFDCLVKFWTLPYEPKAQCSGQILKRPNWWDFSKVSSETPISVPFIWHNLYTSPVLIHEGSTPPLPNRDTSLVISNMTHFYKKKRGNEYYQFSMSQIHFANKVCSLSGHYDNEQNGIGTSKAIAIVQTSNFKPADSKSGQFLTKPIISFDFFYTDFLKKFSRK